jgi:hypothetical protein
VKALIRRGDLVVTQTAITPNDIRHNPVPVGTVAMVLEVWSTRRGTRTYRIFWSGGMSRYPVGDWAIKKLEEE